MIDGVDNRRRPLGARWHIARRDPASNSGGFQRGAGGIAAILSRCEWLMKTSNGMMRWSSTGGRSAYQPGFKSQTVCLLVPRRN
jgi:hypothetical protein